MLLNVDRIPVIGGARGRFNIVEAGHGEQSTCISTVDLRATKGHTLTLAKH